MPVPEIADKAPTFGDESLFLKLLPLERTGGSEGGAADILFIEGY
jgi:hypothetical protein